MGIKTSVMEKYWRSSIILLYLLAMCGSQTLAQPLAVSVARSTTTSEGASPVSFPDLVMDNARAWESSNNSIQVRNGSVYFFHLNAGASAHDRVNMDLQGTVNHCDLFRFSTTHDGPDTLGRDFISNVTSGVSVYLDNIELNSLYSEGDRHTSFSMFDLGNYMDKTEQVIFSVARDTRYSSLGRVQFNQILVNIGGHFNESSSAFKAPVEGLYVLTGSVGLQAETDTRVHINSTTRSRLVEIWRQSRDHNGPDTIGKLIIAQLNAGEEIEMKLQNGELYSDGGRQTFFGGFLYKPAANVSAAWSMFSTEQHDATTDTIDPLPFNGALVNFEDIYDTNSHIITIKHSGPYFVQLSVGAQLLWPVDVSVVRGRWRSEMNIYRNGTLRNGVDTLSQGLLMKLSAGDTLRVVIAAGSKAYSDGDRQIVFSGFLLGHE